MRREEASGTAEETEGPPLVAIKEVGGVASISSGGKLVQRHRCMEWKGSLQRHFKAGSAEGKRKLMMV